MVRTTITLPEELEARARRRAEQRGISFVELIRESLARDLGSSGETVREADPIFAPPAWEGEVPGDLAAEHDRYLYGEPGEP